MYNWYEIYEEDFLGVSYGFRPGRGTHDALDALCVVLEEGPGLFHFRGIDTTRYSKDELRLMYGGIGRHLGTAVSQSMRGDLLGDVGDLGIDINSPQGRGYTSNAQLSYHTDSADVVGLMVLRTARSGGLSMIGSSVAIHNEIARTRPDLLEVLYQPFPWSWQGQEPPGSKPWYLQPICSVHKGKFSCRYIRAHVRNGGQFDDSPSLTEKQVEAMDYFDCGCLYRTAANSARRCAPSTATRGAVRWCAGHVQ
jgi:hypothetical protein